MGTSEDGGFDTEFISICSSPLPVVSVTVTILLFVNAAAYDSVLVWNNLGTILNVCPAESPLIVIFPTSAQFGVIVCKVLHMTSYPPNGFDILLVKLKANAGDVAVSDAVPTSLTV